jgi:hypothetical protein
MPRFQVPSVLSSESAEVGEHAEHGPATTWTVDVDPRALRQHAGEVRGDAAAGDVAERVDAPGIASSRRRSGSV